VFEGEMFCVVDESTNGVFVNHAAKPLGRGVKVVLQDGDVLRMGQYEIVCQLSRVGQELPVDEADIADRAGVADLFNETENAVQSTSGSENDPLAALGVDGGDGLSVHETPMIEGAGGVALGARPAAHPIGAEQDSSRSISSSIQPPRVVENDSGEDLDRYLEQLEQAARAGSTTQSGHTRQPRSRAGAREQPKNSTQGEADVSGLGQDMTTLTPQNRNLWPLLEGLGLTQTPLDDSEVPQFLREVGRALRQAIGGLNDAYNQDGNAESRWFRVAVSQLQPVEDNPIKFADNTDSAIQTLLGERSPVHLGPEDSIRECLQGLQLHQEALAAGVEAGIQAVIASFHPDVLARRFRKYEDNQGRSGDEAWLWEMFVQYSEQVRQNQSRGLRRLFAEVCQETYDRRIRSGLGAESGQGDHPWCTFSD
jgi:type VI secretion system protein